MLDPALATTPKLLPEVRKRFEAMMPFLEFSEQAAGEDCEASRQKLFYEPPWNG